MEKQRAPLLEFGWASLGGTAEMPKAASGVVGPYPIPKIIATLLRPFCSLLVYAVQYSMSQGCWPRCAWHSWASGTAVLLPRLPGVRSFAGGPRIGAGTAGIRLSAPHKPPHTPADAFGVRCCLCLLPRTLGVRKALLAELPLRAEPGRAEHKPPSVWSTRMRRAGSQESLQDSDWLWQVYQLWLSAGSARPGLN